MDNLTTPAILLMLGGIIIAWARNLPPKIGKALARHFLASVYVRDQDLVRQLGVAAIELWGVRSRWVAAALKTHRDRAEVVYEPARGWHFVRRQGRTILLDRGKEDAPSGSSKEIAAMLAPAETFTLYAHRRHTAWLHQLIREAAEYGQAAMSERGLVRIANGWGDWVTLESAQPRRLSSVILPGTQAEDLLRDIREFLISSDWYAARGVPWRLQIGIFGPPGTGKGSLVRGLCTEAGLTLHWPDLTSKSASDNALLQALAKLPPKCAVLLDDLDAALLLTRDVSANGGITLAGLLGALDGPAAGEGRVLFLCSNNPAAFDTALLRDGRIDCWVDLRPATKEQARRLYLLWHPADEIGAERFARDGEGLPMADLQGRLRRGVGSAAREAVAG